MKKICIIGLSCLLLLFSCNKDEDTIAESGNAPIIKDQYGRHIILHGLNTSSSAKGDPLRNPWISELDVEREHKEFGFNFVRYLIFWDAIEPEKGVFSDEYLDRIQKRVEWYTSRGMYVMLDMHQDLYSIVFGGDGAPEWAVRTSGEPINTNIDGPWWLKNIDPAVINSWRNFWQYAKHKDLQEHYILMWQKVVERFKDNPYVLGYDIMNEPWGGDISKVFLTGDFEKILLGDFYRRIIPAIRTVDNQKYIFFEPTPAPVTFGAPSHLLKVKDTRNGEGRIVYAPHCYPYDTHEGNGYTASSKQNLKDWELNRKKDVTTQGNIPLVCGEFGLSPSNIDFDVYLKDVNNVFDRNLWHWTYWSNDKGGWSPLNEDGTETPILQYLIRTYPKAVQGVISSFSFDFDTKKFEMSFNADITITKPTEIFIPQRFYPSGYDLEIVGDDAAITEYDSNLQTLKIKASANNTIQINIQKK